MPAGEWARFVIRFEIPDAGPLPGDGGRHGELLESNPASFVGNADCTPGCYNNEGRPLSARARFGTAGYPLGPAAYFEYIDNLRTSGDFACLDFRTR